MKSTMQDSGPSEMDDLYGESDTNSKPESIDQEEQEDMGAKTVVPMKVLMGDNPEPLKVGEEVVVKVTAINGDQAEIQYSKTKPSEIGSGEEPGDMSPEDELDQMDMKSNY